MAKEGYSIRELTVQNMAICVVENLNSVLGKLGKKRREKGGRLEGALPIQIQLVGIDSGDRFDLPPTEKDDEDESRDEA